MNCGEITSKSRAQTYHELLTGYHSLSTIIHYHYRKLYDFIYRRLSPYRRNRVPDGQFITRYLKHELKWTFIHSECTCCA